MQVAVQNSKSKTSCQPQASSPSKLTLNSKWKQDLSKPPIPSINETFSKYLINLKSILPHIQYKIAEESVGRFISSNESRQLQRLLELFAGRNDNWVTELWLDDMYLRNQVPLPVNSNPAFLLPRQHFETHYEMLWFTAHFIEYAKQFNNKIQNQQLEQDMIVMRHRPVQDENNNEIVDPKINVSKLDNNAQSSIKQLMIGNQQLNSNQPLTHPLSVNQSVNIALNHQSNTLDRVIQSTKSQSFNQLTKHLNRQPLCMQTYKHMFRAYRRPGDQKDDLMINQDGPQNHIVIACRDQFFALSLTVDGENLAASGSFVDYLFANLITIWEFCFRLDTVKENKKFKQEPVGLYTTEHRRTWWLIRNNIIKKQQNLQSLTCIEKCLFVLCLDDVARSSKDHIDEADQLARLLHGAQKHSSNRWFDKFLNVIIGTDGVFGFLMEHSASEGLPVIRFGEEFLDYWQNVNDKKPNSAKLSTNKANLIRTFSNTVPDKLVLPGQVIHLQWHLDTFDLSKLNEAKVHLESLIDGVDLCVDHFTKYGSKWIKENRMSPDCYVQLALQIVFYKLHAKLTSTYESASLRKFRRGRVDNIRSNTTEALLLARAMCGELPNTTNQELIGYFKNAIKKQAKVMEETTSGYGIDNHILGIREMAMRHQSLLIRSNSESSDNTGLNSKNKQTENLPEIFTSYAFKQFVNFQLSTSQVASQKGIVTAYGAVVRNGFGCCYNILPDRITFMVSSFLGGYNVYTNTYNNYNSNYNCSDANISRSKIFSNVLIQTFQELEQLVQLELKA